MIYPFNYWEKKIKLLTFQTKTVKATQIKRSTTQKPNNNFHALEEMRLSEDINK